MSENKYLNEEKYKKAEKSISLVAIFVLVIGLCIGGFLIYKGTAKPSTSKIEDLKVSLENKKIELESKGIKYNEFAKYSDGEEYDLYVITKALDPSFSYCKFDEFKNNTLTKEYCTAKNSTSNFAGRSSVMFGAFICIATCMISGFIFFIAKRRHILAFSAQQVMPVAKEGINEMAPTIGNVAGQIAKGVKEGLKDEDK